LTVSRLSEEEFGRFRVQWNNLLDESASESFFLKWEWCYTFWQTIDRHSAKLLVLLCHEGAKLVGIAPMYSYQSTFLRIPVRKVAFLGDRVAGDYMDIIAKPGHESACCRSVLRELRRHGRDRYALIELDAVCADSSLYRFAARESASDPYISIVRRFDCPRAILGASYADYVKSLSPSTRYAMRRREQKLGRQFPDHEVINIDLKQRPELLDILFELHRQRWETVKSATTTFYSEFRKRFNAQLLDRLGANEGFFSYLTIAGKPASMLYVFTYKRNAFFYQNGWTPEFAPLGVGLVNIQHALRCAAENGFLTFDFLRGQEDYKYKFCRDSRPAHVVIIFGQGFVGRAVRRLHELKLMLKSRSTQAASAAQGPVVLEA